MIFENIKNIVISKPASWKNKIFLTFDTDWACDEVLSYSIDIIERYGIRATFFMTHKTPLLKRLRGNSKIEIGIHPNFNFLLNGDFRYGKNIKQVVAYYKKICPQALSVRSHSMTQSSKILDVFTSYGLKFDCNHFIPFDANIDLKPWMFWNGRLSKIPYFWEDDAHCLYGWKWDPAEYSFNRHLKVFDFHPSHVYLNTEDMKRYHKSRDVLSDVQALSKNINKRKFGIRDFLTKLIENNI